MSSNGRLNLGCCFRDSEDNRKLAVDLAKNFYKSYGVKQYIVAFNKQIRSASEAELASLQMQYPNLEIVE